MAIDKLNSLQFLFLRADYFQEPSDSDYCGGHSRRLPAISIFSARGPRRYLAGGLGGVSQWWVCRAMDRQLGAEGERYRVSPAFRRSAGIVGGIIEIINRGDHEAFASLLHIIEQPGGPVADRVRTLYERVQHRAADPKLAAWPHYQAAYWLAVAMGQFRTTREDKA